MAYTLKLDIYFFSLHKITKATKRNTKAGIRLGYKVEDKDSNFCDFFNSFGCEKNKDFMQTFIEDFINGFNSSFKFNKNYTQAISITSDLYRKYNSRKYTICGTYKGGQIGINREIYQSNDAEEVKNTITEDDVTSLCYFYKIWFPINSNRGILMLQSYTSLGCSSLFKEELGEYFIKKGYRANWYRFVPKEYIEKYLKDGYLNKLQIIYSKRDNNTPLSPIFTPFKGATRKSVFSKFKIPLSNIFSLPNYKEILKNNIQAIDVNFNADADIVKLSYKCNGRSANTTLAEIENILPHITLDDGFKDSNTQLPKWEELNIFTDHILEQIKEQINYIPIRLK